jgi:hypothetical protein
MRGWWKERRESEMRYDFRRGKHMFEHGVED